MDTKNSKFSFFFYGKEKTIFNLRVTIIGHRGGPQCKIREKSMKGGTK
jgi:hypothetical protein